MSVCFNQKSKSLNGRVKLVASKSESNRILIIKAVSKLPIKIKNLSASKDTQTLADILASERIRPAIEFTPLYDVGAAGTTMRFLTALFACRPGNYVVTGSDRMKRRPIKHLVDALEKLGAQIKYLETEGNPPLKIRGNVLRGGEIDIDGSVSSQFTSALMMVAPLLQNGLVLNFKNGLVSKSYVKMTAAVMKRYGVNVEWNESRMIVPPGEYKVLNDIDNEYTVEGDWSSASYLYAFAALSDSADIFIEGLKKDSAQADSACAELFVQFGVSTEYQADGIRITKLKSLVPDEFNYDFSECPDIAQTFAVVCAALKVRATLSGLITLRVKETDRIAALQHELMKLNVETVNESDSVLKIFPQNADFSKNDLIETYEDHRMAMAFAPMLMVKQRLCFDDKEVVKKSYPSFWNDLVSLNAISVG